MSPSRAVALAALAAAAATAVLLLPPGGAALLVFAAVVAAAWLRPPPASRPLPAGIAEPALPPASLAPEVTRIIDRFAEGVLLLDAQQTVIAANESAAAILGRPRTAMTGVSLIRAARDAALVEVLRESSGVPRQVTMGDHVLLATASTLDAGAVRQVLTLQDVTALRRAERARQELVGNVSHELRTPIAAARALAETLEAGVDEEEQRARFHAQLTSEIERLGSIVDRLLRLSRIESGTEEFRPAGVSLRDLAQEARRRILPVAERKAIEIEVEEVPALTVRADRERILEVIANLLDNAIRHSPRGERVRLLAGAEGAMARVSVVDRGPGILPSDRLRVFERFYTGDRARGEGVGTGLGLAIARHIVGRHGGEIWVADETPGTTMCFTLPLDGQSKADGRAEGADRPAD